MDVTKMRVDFSKHLLLLDDLNKQLTEHVSELQVRLKEEQAKHAETLLKTQKKLDKSTNEGEIEKNHVIKYKNRLRRYHELTKTKETEWINFTKHLKEFYINCTCQTKDASVKLPTQMENKLTQDCLLTSPTQKPTADMTSLSITTKHRQGVSKLKRVRHHVPVKKKCVLSPDSLLDVTPSTSYSPNGSSPASNVPGGTILYVKDSQEPKNELERSEADLTLVKAISSKTNSKSTKLQKLSISSDSEITDPVSPVLDLNALSHAQHDYFSDELTDCTAGDTLGATPTKCVVRPKCVVRKFNLLTECRSNVSISEDLLGFSLPGQLGKSEQAVHSEKYDIGVETRVEAVSTAKEQVSSEKKEEDLVEKEAVSTEQLSSEIEKKDKPSSSDAKQPPRFKHASVVRKKAERAQLAASSCSSCYKYYKACGLDEEEILKLIGDVSRHRHLHHQRPDSPASMWDLTIAHKTIPVEPPSQKKRKKNKYMTRRDC